MFRRMVRPTHVHTIDALMTAVSSWAPQLLKVSLELMVHTDIVWPVVCCVEVCSCNCCPLLSSALPPCTRSFRSRLE